MRTSPVHPVLYLEDLGSIARHHCEGACLGDFVLLMDLTSRMVQMLGPSCLHLLVVGLLKVLLLRMIEHVGTRSLHMTVFLSVLAVHVHSSLRHRRCMLSLEVMLEATSQVDGIVVLYRCVRLYLQIVHFLLSVFLFLDCCTLNIGFLVKYRILGMWVAFHGLCIPFAVRIFLVHGTLDGVILFHILWSLRTVKHMDC